PPLSLAARSSPLLPSNCTSILLLRPVSARLKFPRLATSNSKKSARSFADSESVYRRIPLKLPKSSAAAVDPPGSELNVAHADNNVLDSSRSIIRAPSSMHPTDQPQPCWKPQNSAKHHQLALASGHRKYQQIPCHFFYYPTATADYSLKSVTLLGPALRPASTGAVRVDT